MRSSGGMWIRTDRPTMAHLFWNKLRKSQKPHVETLLGAGVRLLLYQGQFDWKDGVVSNEAWIRSLNWTGPQRRS